MYLITNRALKRSNGLDVFGKTPNAKGPNELRLVEVSTSAEGVWDVNPISDRLTQKRVRELKVKYELDIDLRAPWFASLEVACALFDRARREHKSILFFVHGYNNDVGDVLKAAETIEQLYDVIVVPFTWPANGGGVISGVASYLSDKTDARASAGALNRAIGKIQQYHKLMTRAQNIKLQRLADAKYPDNPMTAASYYTAMQEKACLVKISLLCHSMGNYVFKHTFATSENITSDLTFDNICLVAADTNSCDHRNWVGQLDVRRRVYVVLNEDDAALKAARIKPGDEQKARLGHYLKGLDSPNACYIDLTDVEHIGSEHTYFKGDAINNRHVKGLFRDMFRGEAVEEEMSYRVDNNTYRMQ